MTTLVTLGPPLADAPRLIFFPYAGASANAFRPWSVQLAGLECFSIELPGRGSRIQEAPTHDLMKHVEQIMSDIYALLDRPLYLFGHSLGAILALEVAAALQNQCNIRVSHLFISGRSAPQLANYKRPAIHTLPGPEFLAKLYELGGIPEALRTQSELLELLLPALRADFRMSFEYRPTSKRRLESPIAVFGASGDDAASIEQLYGWQEITSGAFSVRMFEGDHFFIHMHRRQLCQIILEKAAKG